VSGGANDGPSRELLQEISRDRELGFTPEQIDAAHAMLRRYRDELERVRSIEFDYLNPVEPAHALQWIQQGGQSND
jgi:hypothetical protein